MTQVDVNANLQVEDGGTPRPLRTTDLYPADYTQQGTLVAILAELGQKLEPADVAALSTAAKQDAAKAVLDSILASVDGLESKDFATQTTLAAVLAELSQKLEPGDLAALATAAKQDASKAVLDQIAALVAGRLETHMPYHSDVFGGLVTGARDNQIEVHYDDVNWATYVSTTQSGGGSASQHEGHVHFETGTGQNGKSKAVTLDVIKYRPMHEIYSGWTAAFPVVGVANSYMRIGFADSAYLNGLVTGYEGTSFGLTWFRNGVATTVAQAAWDDPCDGSPGSAFTRDGVPEALNPAFTNIFRARVGLLGSAHLILEVYTPDGEWIPVHTFKRPNLSSEPTFTNFDLPMLADVNKTGAGAAALEIRTACWAGGTTSQSARLSDTITDRSLAQTVRAVIEGKTPSGSYAKVTVNSAGRLQVTNDSVGTDGTAAPAGTTAVGGLGPGGLLQTLMTDAAGILSTADAPVLAILQTIATALDNRFGGGKTPHGAQVTAVGDTTVLTPTFGKRLQIFKVSAMNDPDESVSPRIIVKFAGGVEINRSYVIGAWEPLVGDVDESVVVNLDQAGNVAVFLLYKEIA